MALPAILAASLIGGLAQAATSLVGRVLIALGIGYVTYAGLDVLLDFIKTRVFQELLSVDPTIIGIMAVLNVDRAINVVLSAIAARLLLNGLTSGSITRMVTK
jgi:hypothetical protein